MLNLLKETTHICRLLFIKGKLSGGCDWISMSKKFYSRIFSPVKDEGRSLKNEEQEKEIKMSALE